MRVSEDNFRICFFVCFDDSELRAPKSRLNKCALEILTKESLESPGLDSLGSLTKCLRRLIKSLQSSVFNGILPTSEEN